MAYENVITDVTSLIFSGMGEFATRIGSAFTDLVGNIFLSTEYTYVESGVTPTFTFDSYNTIVGELAYVDVYPNVFDILSNLGVVFDAGEYDDYVDFNGSTWSDDGEYLIGYSGMDLNMNSVLVNSVNTQLGFDLLYYDDGPAVNIILYVNEKTSSSVNFKTYELQSSYHLNAFGFVTIAFSALALMFGLSRWIVNMCTSWGKRNK